MRPPLAPPRIAPMAPRTVPIRAPAQRGSSCRTRAPVKRHVRGHRSPLARLRSRVPQLTRPLTPAMSLNRHNDSIMAKRRNEQTSQPVGSKAGTLLRNPKTPAVVKSVAASALTQRPNRSVSRRAK
jgi:hypothetical protein